MIAAPCIALTNPRPLFLAMVVLVLSSCGSEAPSLDTSPLDRAARTYVLVGTVRGEVSGGKACFWVESAEGHATALLWPEGYRVERGPLRVLDADGAEVVREGVRHEFGGGSAPEGYAPCRPNAKLYQVAPGD